VWLISAHISSSTTTLVLQPEGQSFYDDRCYVRLSVTYVCIVIGWRQHCQRKRLALVLLLSGTHCRITVDPPNFSALLSVARKKNCLILPAIVNVNAQPSLRHYAPLIRSRHMALYNYTTVHLIAQCSALMLLRKEILGDCNLSFDTLSDIHWHLLLSFVKASKRFYRSSGLSGMRTGPELWPQRWVSA